MMGKKKRSYRQVEMADDVAQQIRVIAVMNDLHVRDVATALMEYILSDETLKQKVIEKLKLGNSK